MPVLHDAAQKATSHVYMVQTSSQNVFVDKPTRPQQCDVKGSVSPPSWSRVHLWHLDAILDDGSDRTMVLSWLLLRTVRDDIVGVPRSVFIPPAVAQRSA